MAPHYPENSNVGGPRYPSGLPATRRIDTTTPLTGGGDLSADRTLTINDFGGDAGSGGTRGAVPAPAAGAAAARKYLKADGTWEPIAEADVAGLTADLGDKAAGPGTATDSDFVQFSGATGKLLKDGGISLDTDGTLAANSDTRVPSQRAVLSYLAAHGTVNFADNETPTGVRDGANKTFVLPNSPSPGASLILYQRFAGGMGIILIQGVDYTLAGGTITTTNAPAVGDALYAWCRY